MDPDPDRNVGCTDLSGKSDSVPAAPATAATPAVTRPGAGPSSAMVTRSRPRGGREVNIEPEVEFLPEVDIPAETDEQGSGATRQTADVTSQYIPEVATSQEVTTIATTTTKPRNHKVHTGSLTSGKIQPAGRSVTSTDISGTETSMPTLSYYGDLSIADSASRARAFVGDLAIQPHGEVAMYGDMAITSHGDIAIRLPGDTAFVQLYTPARDAPISVGEGVVAVPPPRMDPAPLVTEPYRLSKSPQTIQAWRTHVQPSHSEYMPPVSIQSSGIFHERPWSGVSSFLTAHQHIKGYFMP